MSAFSASAIDAAATLFFSKTTMRGEHVVGVRAKRRRGAERVFSVELAGAPPRQTRHKTQRARPRFFFLA